MKATKERVDEFQRQSIEKFRTSMADLIEKQQVQNSDMSQRNTDSNVEIELMLENVISQFNDKASVILNDIVDNFYDQKTQSNPEETRLQMMKFV